MEEYVRVLGGPAQNGMVRDQGAGIADVEIDSEPMFTTGKPEERSGMGFTVMESFMDRVEVTSCVGEGTTVTMIKQLDVGDGF